MQNNSGQTPAQVAGMCNQDLAAQYLAQAGALHPQGPGGFEINSRIGAPQGHQQPPKRTPVLKPSSNSNVPVAWITEPTMDSRYILL